MEVKNIVKELDHQSLLKLLDKIVGNRMDTVSKYNSIDLLTVSKEKLYQTLRVTTLTKLVSLIQTILAFIFSHVV